MSTKFWLAAVFSFFMYTLSGQTFSGKIEGKVLDSKSKPIEQATVLLTNTADPKDSRTVFTLPDGHFLFDNLAAGSYEIKIHYLGCVPFSGTGYIVSEQTPALAVPDIKLQPDETLLKEVTVTSRVLPVERKADKTVVNVDAFIGNAGASVLDVLANSPGVSVDQNGVIQLLGKAGVIIYIDDKPTYLAGAELESYLRSMPSSQLKQIELMTNPPAKYDAAGNAGIINLRTKRSKLKGVSGTVSANYGQGKYARSNNALNLNYNTQKITFFSNASFGIQNSFQDLNINRTYKNPDGSVASYFKQNSYIKKQGNSQELRLGLDYYLTETTVFGATAKGFYSPSSSDVNNVSLVSGSDGVLERTVRADNATDGQFKNGTVSLNFRRQLNNQGRNITADLDYLAYRNTNDQLFRNTGYDAGGVLDYQDRLDGNIPLDIKIIAFKSDYAHPLKNNANLSGGIKSSFTKTNNKAEYFTTIDDVTTPNYDISNTFIYDETINAAYVNYDKSYDRLSMQFGLRVENTDAKGRQLGNEAVAPSRFNRNYTNFFPTVFFSYRLDSIAKHQLTFSYGKRIDRPFYKDLNPFISPLDKFTYYSGNPFLQPTFSNNFSVGHIFKNNFSTTLNYSIIDDAISETLEIRDNVYYSRPGNISGSSAVTLSLNGNFPLAKWWSLNAYTEIGHVRYKSKLYNERLDTSGNYLVFRGVNSFTVSKTFAAELSGEYTSNYTAAQLIAGDVGFISIGFRKKILNQKGNLRFNISDVLYTRKFRGIINNLTLTDANYNSRVDTRVASLTFSYQFGQSDSKRKKYNSTGSESEQKRVKV